MLSPNSHLKRRIYLVQVYAPIVDKDEDIINTFYEQIDHKRKDKFNKHKNIKEMTGIRKSTATNILKNDNGRIITRKESCNNGQNISKCYTKMKEGAVFELSAGVW